MELHLVMRQFPSHDLLCSYSLNRMNRILEIMSSIVLGLSFVDWRC